MASNAVLAPRGSRFLSSEGNLTPAWHHYLANIETLAIDLNTTFDGQALLVIEARIAALEDAVSAVEATLPKRNWKFLYTNQAIVNSDHDGNSFLTIVHGLNTKLVMARSQYRNSGSTYNSSVQSSNDGNVIGLRILPDSGNGQVEAWVLGFYEDLQ